MWKECANDSCVACWGNQVLINSQLKGPLDMPMSKPMPVWTALEPQPTPVSQLSAPQGVFPDSH